MKRHTCSAVAKQLPLLLQNELPEEEKRRTLAHLSDCSRCQKAHEKLHRTLELVQTWKTEPENFEAFNQTLFQRIRESRPNRAFVLRPARRIVWSAVLVPTVSFCLLLLAIGVWQKVEEVHLAKAEATLNELSLLDNLEEEVPEVETEFLEEELLSQDEMLLAEATLSPPKEDLLEELELLEQAGEAEGLRDDFPEELEENFF